MDQITLVVALGLGTVFVGLICIILLIMAMHSIMEKATSASSSVPTAPAASAAAPTATAPAVQNASAIPNRQELVAAVSAVLAEELGTDVSAIRIHSIRKI